MSIENRASVELIDPALAYTRFFHALNVHATKLHLESFMFYAMLQTLLDSWFVYNQQFPSVLQSGSGSALEQSAV